MLTAPGFPSKRKPSSTLPCSPAPLCLGVHGSQPLPPHMGLVSAIVPKAGTIFKVQEARGWVPGTGAPRDQGPGREGPKLGAGRGHWGWGAAAGGSSGSGGGGPDPASSSSFSSSNGTPSSWRKSWRTLRVVRVRGRRLQGTEQVSQPRPSPESSRTETLNPLSNNPLFPSPSPLCFTPVEQGSARGRGRCYPTSKERSLDQTLKQIRAGLCDKRQRF